MTEEGLSQEWYSVQEAAKLLRVSDSTIYRYIASGKLPAYKLAGYVVRTKREDLMRLLERKQVE